ncbi:MAG TPA: DedA family protein [Bdellovibrionota bacterium]|jgi:membrane-associated protein
MEIAQRLVHLFLQAVDIVLHINVHLNDWITHFGGWTYAILFAILFAETGLIVMPFLPGDSLLFALGALSAGDDAFLRFSILVPTLLVAVFLGDSVNYFVGRKVGLKLFQNPKSKIFRKEYLDRTEKFYAKHGGKMVILARFAPILRTFSPFVAGMAKMNYSRFLAYSVGGSVTWVSIFLGAGYYFGNIPAVKRNFHIVIVAILVISALPALIEAWKIRQESRRLRAKT